MSKFKFTNKMFLNDAVNSHVAAKMANAALDEYLLTLKRVYGVTFERDDLSLSFEKDEADTHTALLWDLEEIKPEPCKHEVLHARWDDKIDCKQCGKILVYRLVEV